MRLMLLLLLILNFPNKLLAQKSMIDDKEMQELVKKGLNKTYNFEFTEAEKLFLQVEKKYPEHPAYNFLMASNLLWQMLYDDSYKEKSKEYFNYLETSLKLASPYLKKDKRDVEGVFFTMAIESCIAIYFAERGDNGKAMNHAKKAYDFMKAGFILKEKYVDFYFSTGLYDYFVVEYPETHPIYKPFMIFFSNGNKSRGIKELENCVKNGIFSRTESLHYLSNIFSKYENEPARSITYTDRLVKDYPQNYYFISRHVENLIALEKYKEAEVYAYKLFHTEKKSFVMRSYVFYGMLNEKHFKKPAEAMDYYKAAIKLSKELSQPVKEYVSFALIGIARIHHANGNKQEAIAHYKSAKEIADYKSVKKEIKEYLDKYD
jgi:tetratricopeptide (TPR) repeat protein